MKENYRSGFVAIIGRPNVGKSTLMNAMIGEKIAIISDKPQTTRNRIQCVLTRPDYQLIFLDTSGIHKPKNKLGEYMVQTARSSLEEVDAVLFVVDVAEGVGAGDKFILESLKDLDTPVILVANKVDRASKAKVDEELDAFTAMGRFSDVIRVSALNGTNIPELEKLIVSYMPEGPQYYPDDMITDQPERVIIAELIREKALELLKDEVPHGIGVEVMKMEERSGKDLLDIHATIYCEKKSHKAIVIGKGGKMLKEIGQRARQDIEKLLGTHVYMELWIKVKEDWRNNSSMLKTLGYE